MPRFFCDDVLDDEIILTGEDAIHLSRSLRVRIGEEITVCDGRCMDYLCTVENVSSEAVTLAVKKKAPCEAEPKQAITLYQAAQGRQARLYCAEGSRAWGFAHCTGTNAVLRGKKRCAQL